MSSIFNVKPAGQSVFGGSTTNAFGQTTNTNTHSQPQQSAFGQTTTGFGQTAAMGQSQTMPQQQLGSSLWQPGSLTPHQKSVPDQMKALLDKWDPTNPNTAFKIYLYNKVDEAAVPHYRPGPSEDAAEWEAALARKPAANFMPVLCPGFPGLIARLLLQKRALTEYNTKLHEINACLDAILARHDVDHSVRALNARRRHDALRRRCLALAARVQCLRNRGYALSSDEDDLARKLRAVERGVCDPALTSRLEELWSRLILLRGYAENLRAEMVRGAKEEKEAIGEENEGKIKKILEDYEKQLQHLKKEIGHITEDMEEWQKDHQPAPAPK